MFRPSEIVGLRGGATLWLGGLGPPKPKGSPQKERKNLKKKEKI
jgi:hypothetical protein